MDMETAMDAASLPDFKLIPYLPSSSSPASNASLSNSDSDRNPDPNIRDPQTQPPPGKEEEKNPPLALKTSSSWTYCGPLLTLSPLDLPTSFHTWAKATINGCLLPSLTPFLAFVHQFLQTNDLSHYWLTIRATQGNHDFDMPRWHMDEEFFGEEGMMARMGGRIEQERVENDRAATTSMPNFFRSYIQRSKSKPKPSFPSPKTLSHEQTTFKLTTTLLGPGTLFIPLPSTPSTRHLLTKTQQTLSAQNPHTCLFIRCLGCADTSALVRSHLATALADQTAVQAQSGECAFFRVGPEKGAVHSEPEAHGDRIFVNVVPGTKEELRALMGRWGMEFPRAWCVGVSILGDGDGGEDGGRVRDTFI